MQNILNLSKTNKLILATIVFLAVLAFGSGRAHAATVTVGGSCTLDYAIASINGGTPETECVSNSTGSYGSNDTINIPAGTQTLTANLPVITEPVKVQGAGMSQTTVDGDGQYTALQANGVAVEIRDLKVTGFRTAAIATESCDVTLRSIEVDGDNAVTSGILYGIRLSSSASSTKTVDVDGVYIHNINTNAPQGVQVFLVQQFNGTTTNATLKNTTLSDIHHTGAAGLNGFTMGVGMFGSGFGSTGTVNAQIINTTIDDVTADGIAGPFASVAFANGGNATVNTTVYNATITRTSGATGNFVPVVGVPSGAFYAAAAGVLSGNVGTANVSVGNSLLADNTTDGTTSNNCSTVDITSGVSGAGTGNTSIGSLGYNMSDDATCTTFTGTGDQQNVNNIISTLGPLQDNGGSVPTRALLEGSPAISAGGAVLGVTTDARGVARPAACVSVGAFQFEGAVCGASTTNNGTSAGAPNTGAKTASTLAAVIASILGLTILGYAVKKRA